MIDGARKSMWALRATGDSTALAEAANAAWPAALILRADPEQRLRTALGLRSGPPAFDVIAHEWGVSGPLLPIDLVPLVAGWARVDVDEYERWDRLGVHPWPGPVQISFVAGRAELSAETVWRHHQEHSELAREHHPAIARYVQGVVRATAGPDAPPAAALSELWFESDEDAVARFYRNEDSVAVVREDISEYIDFRRTVTVFATVHAGEWPRHPDRSIL